MSPLVSFRWNIQLRRADGEHQWVFDRACSPFLGNHVRGIRGSAVDITDFKRAIESMFLAGKADSGLHSREHIERVPKLADEGVGTVRMLTASAGAGGDPNDVQNLDLSFVPGPPVASFHMRSSILAQGLDARLN